MLLPLVDVEPAEIVKSLPAVVEVVAATLIVASCPFPKPTSPPVTVKSVPTVAVVVVVNAPVTANVLPSKVKFASP